MTEDLTLQINNLLKQCEGIQANTSLIISFFLYGSVGNLVAASKDIKLKATNAITEIGDNSLVIIDTVLLAQDQIYKKVRFYQDIANSYGIELDGFEINLEEQSSTHGVKPFDEDHQHGTTFCWPLKSGGFGHGIFLAGNKNTGFLFEFSSLITDKPVDAQTITNDWKPLYKQPIFAVIEPSFIIATGHMRSIHSQTNQTINFRIEVGTASIDQLYEIRPELQNEATTQDDWIDFLIGLVRAGKTIKIDNWGLISAKITNKGKLTVKENYVCTDLDLIRNSYVYGVFGNLDMIESSIIGGDRDLVILNDKVFTCH